MFMKFKKYFTLALVLAVMSAVMISCNFGEFSGFKKTKTGTYYKVYTNDNNDTTQVRKGSIVTISLKYGLKDSTMFDSKEMPQPIILPVQEPQYEGDFYECLTMLQKGDSATFILKAGPLFTKTFGQPALPEPLTEESDIYFDVAVKNVQTQEEIDRETQVRNMQLEQEEMTKLEEYVRANNITAQPTASGIYFLETKKGTGKSPVQDGYVTAHYTVHLLGGQQLFSTVERGEPIDFKCGSQFENEGFMEVIMMMKEGGKCNAIIPSSKAFGAQGAGQVVPPFSTLYYDIELVKTMSNDEFQAKQAKKQEQKAAESARLKAEESSLLQKYLKDNNITPTKTLPNGLIYIETLAGTGPQPIDGKKVKVQYTGKLLNGTVFDSSVDKGKPYEFPLGRKQVIEGWDAGIPLMKVGGKAILIVPSSLAYKDRGAGDRIPPYSTLVFEVELVEAEQ
jgi:FKBP-type peptidyl-prolyl cis-trans isomerase